MEPKSAPGAPWEGENSLGNSPGGPPEVHHDFFSAPEASGSDLGALRGGKIRISCCGPCFFRLREAPGSDFGAILARFWARCSKVFEAILRFMLRCVGGCSRCSSCWLASTFSVSSWRCGAHFAQGFSGIEPETRGENRRKTAGKLQETLPPQTAEAAARSADARL